MLALQLSLDASAVSPSSTTNGPLPAIMDSVGVWGDYDGDGDLDVLLAGFSKSLAGIPDGRFARIYRNDNDGTFHDIEAPLIPVDGTGAAWGDYDNDGDLDLLLTGMADMPSNTESVSRVYRNNGSDTFTDIGAGLVGVGQGSASWVDFDNDGDLDICIAGWTLPGNGYPTLLYRNAGSGTFVSTPASFPYVANGDNRWGDYDNDGDADLFLAGLPGTFLLRNDNGLLVNLNLSLPGRPYFSSDWGDADNDGDLDILTSVFLSEPHVHVLRNNGNTTFTDSTLSTLAVEPTSGRFGDFDNDGAPDILLQGQDAFGANLIQVFRSTSIGYQLIFAQPGVYNGSATWVDINNDGNLDIFYTGRISNSPLIGRTGFYTNTTTTVNHPPDAPTDLDYFKPNPDEVVLTWSPANDPQRTPGLSYNVRVGRTPGGIEVVSPHSDPTTGRRHLLALGNAGTATRWRLRDLPAGQYYWSVQAIDAAFVSSPFSVEGTFTSTNSRPFISDIANVIVGVDTTAPEVAFTVSDSESPAGDLQLSAESSNPDLLLKTSIYFGGAGSNRTAHLVPTPLRTGITIVTITVRDPSGETRSDSFSLTVYNTPPQISAVPGQHLLPGAPPPALPFTVSDAEAPPEALLLIPASSNTTLVPTANIAFSGTGSARTVTVTPAADQRGSAMITLTVRDPQGLSATNAFRFDVSEFVEATTNITGGLTGVNQPIASWADYDNDNDLDLLFGGNTGINGILHLYRNDGSGRFIDSGVALPAVYFGSAAWGDYDNDGDLDVLITGVAYIGGGAITKVFRNNSDGTFEDTGISLPPFYNGTALWSDFDQDGRLDALVSGVHVGVGRFTRIYRNNGSNSFALFATFPGQDRQGVAVADYDRDGDNDLALALNERSRIYRNDGAGVFTDIQVSLSAMSFGSVAWGDYDNDGWPDLALIGSTNALNSGAVARVYRNQTGGSFSNINAAIPGGHLGSVAWADGDNDGDLDLALTGLASNGLSVARLYLNTGGAFAELSTPWPGVSESAFAWGDCDNDSDLDLVLAGLTGNGRTAALFRNATNPLNTPPTAPTSLTVTLLLNNDVSLSWLPSNDNQTTDSTGLTYNVRIGTTPGGSELLAPHSDPATGYRRLVDFGNVGSTTARRLVDLPRGDYFWNAQAIDTAFAGSAFAVEASFSITNSRPEISGIPNLSTGPSTPTTNVAFTIGDFETPAEDLQLLVASSNTNLLPLANIAFGGSGSNRTIRLIPAGNLVGSSTVSVTVVDTAGATRSRSFTFIVDEFTPLSASFPRLGSSSAADWGDYDNDGDLDLLLTGMDSERVLRTYLFRNDGAAGFSEVAAGLPGMNGAGSWGDYDQDGNLDLLLVGSASTRIYRNGEDNAFTDIAAGLPAISQGAGAWADYDNDGDLDFVLAGFAKDLQSPPGSSSFSRLYRNDGSNAFTQVPTILPAVANAYIAWGDYDIDGDLDLLLSGRLASQQAITRVYRNNGNGDFVDIQAGLPGGPGSVAWGDYDQDGDLDILANASSAGTFVIRNNGDHTFTQILPALSMVAGGTVAWGDFDNDGWIDALVTGTSTPTALIPTTQIFRNRHDGTFSEIPRTLPGAYGGRSAWGDFDRDGDLDLFLASATNRLARNNASTPNTPPQAPLVPSASVLATGRVNLSWTRSTDGQTTNNVALHYNLRIGTTPGGQDVMSPHSDLGTGLRRLARPGNAGSTNSWSLRLPPGTYFWSVQAIDPALAGSPFSSEAAFTITNSPPGASTPFLTVYEDASIVFTPPGIDPDLQVLTYAIVTPPTNGIITGTSPSFTYRPVTNYFGPDTFTFTVSDGIVTTTPAPAYITVVPVADVESTRLSLTASTNGVFTLTILGEPYQSYRIDSSEDLAHWTELTNGAVTSTGLILFNDPRPTGPQRFYRSSNPAPLPPF